MVSNIYIYIYISLNVKSGSNKHTSLAPGWPAKQPNGLQVGGRKEESLRLLITILTRYLNITLRLYTHSQKIAKIVQIIN